MTQISWTEKQFEALAYQLVKGVNELHRQKIAHRDIRPHNVVYSGIKKGYVLTGLHNSIDLSKGSKNLGFNLSGVPYYMPRFLAEVGKK
jgi:serine/threonine protein kinase